MRKRKRVLKHLTERLPARIMTALLAAALALGLTSSMSNADPAEAESRRIAQTAQDIKMVRVYAEQLMDQNRKDDYTRGGFTWDTENRPTSWRYYNGFMIDALLRLDPEGSWEYAKAFYQDHLLPDGAIRDYLEGYLDSVEPARPLWRLIADSDPESAERYLCAVQWVYAQLDNQLTYPACGNNYCHHQESSRKPARSSRKYPIFLDGLYMTQPFLAECALAIRKGQISLTDSRGQAVSAETLENEIVNRYVWLRAYLFDRDKVLYQHGWDVTTRQANGHYWGRGIGWLAMSMADVIGLLPDGAGKDRMISMLQELLDGMLNYQDPDTGMWFNVIDRGTDLPDNRLETSATCMMAYTLMRAWNDGYGRDIYLEKGIQAFHGTVREKLFEQNGRIHVRDTYLKSGVGESDEYYCAEPYTTDEAKGTAALILAAAEMETACGMLNAE